MSQLLEIKNAVITEADLSLEGGPLSLTLGVSYGSTFQYIPTYILHLPNDWTHYRREGPAGEMILRLMEIAEVKKFSELVGRNIRVRATHDRIDSIGHIIHEDWFRFAELKADVGGGGS